MKQISTILFLLLMLCSRATAQCTAENKAFQGGERLEYQLFFNWKFVWVKAGSATMQTQSTTYDGQPAFKTHLLTRTSQSLDKFFRMRDTLECIITPNLVPLRYKKAADEGGRYYIDRVWYSYPDGRTHLRQEAVNARGELKQKTTDTDDCVYDMLSLMMRARSFDATGMKKGERMKFNMTDGNKVERINVVYRGKENTAMKTGDATYRCLVFSFIEHEGGKEKEVITFYITDDDNHIPVRLDMYLRFGTAKVYLSETHGLKNPMKAKL